MGNLTYRTAWRSISARTRGLENAAKVHAAFLAINSGSPYGADRELAQHCAGIWDEIKGFRASFRQSLPHAVIRAVDRFATNGGKQIEQNTAGDSLLTRTCIVKLIAIDSEISYCLDDPMERVRSTSELAFMHLQRLIAVDKEYREKWQAAFAKNEPQCERLGGLHLLWHGIWAFKVDATGGRTDLVYQDTLITEKIPVALGMVLTEWKKVTGDTQQAYAEAKAQTDQYASGVLAGVELTSHRYLIVVTEQEIDPLPDIVEGSIVYRRINIAVSPRNPSVAAKALSKSSP